MSAARETTLRELRGIRSRVDALIKLLEGNTASAPIDPDPAVPRPFVGIPLESKYAGRCVVCGNGYDVGAAIVYARELKKAAHLGCGQPAPRGAR